jgi:hypothetical protein
MGDEDESEFYEEIERPSVPFRALDAVVLLVDFLDDLAASFHNLTSRLLWKVAAHSNHTLDQEQAQQAAEASVEII